MTDTSSRSETTRESSSLAYQPALDGVRAIAIVMVVLFHYPWGLRPFQVEPAHGGFLGVDIFFVLSGFLITTLLVREFAANGDVSLRRFYARRALRLLPALAVLLAIGCILHVMASPKDPVRPESIGLISIVFYVGNWVKIARPGSLGVMTNTWSLAIEEQFYIVWPLLLLVMLRKKLPLGAIAGVTAAGIAASAAWSARYWHDRLGRLDLSNAFVGFVTARVHRQVWNRIYFGSDTRADALLAGCLIAILLPSVLRHCDRRGRAALGAVSLVAAVVIGVIVSKANTINSAWLPEWGFLVLALCTGVLVAGLVGFPEGLLARALALPPLVWVGRRSYAIYLFHQLVYWGCDRARVPLQPQLSFLFQMGVILVAAELSYRLVEAPMLRRKRHFESTPRVLAADGAA